MDQCYLIQSCFWFLTLFICLNNAIELPSYIKPCPKANHQKLNECAKKNGQAAIPRLMKGDPKYKLPVMNPLEIENIQIEETRDLKVFLEKVLIYGLDKTKIDYIDIDLAKNHINITLAIPKVDIKGTYTIDGRILILPINGHGPIHLVAPDGIFYVSIDQELVKRNGKQHLHFKKVDVDIKLGGLKLQLDNLFNGHEQLGKDANTFLNANWQEVVEILKPALSSTIGKIIQELADNILERVEFENIFT